jgi:hypothetical protein
MRRLARTLPLVATLSALGALSGCAAGGPAAPSPAGPPTIAMEALPTAPPTQAPTPLPTLDPALNAPPAVQIISLQDNSELHVGREASAAVLSADSDGIDRVELRIDGQVVSTVRSNDGAAEFQGLLTWTPEAAGSHTAAVAVYDRSGLLTEVKRTVVYVQPPPTVAAQPTAAPTATSAADTVAPAVSITAAPGSVAAGADVNVGVNAVDAHGVTRVELMVDDTVVNWWNADPAAGPAPTSVSQTLVWHDASPGSHQLWVRAYDAAGHIGESPRQTLDVQ